MEYVLRQNAKFAWLNDQITERQNVKNVKFFLFFSYFAVDQNISGIGQIMILKFLAFSSYG